MIKERKYQESQLLKMLINDNEQAFQLLFEKHKDHVYKIAKMYLKSSSVAEEVLQDVFMKVWLNRKALVHVNSFESWLFIISRNVIINYAKHLASEWKAQKLYSINNSTIVNHTDYKIRSAQSHEILQKIILNLSPQQQIVYKLAKEDQLSYKQIADKLSISSLTVKTHLARALKYLRSSLKANEI